ncbi:MAG TPA: pentapeptide repeat-containing protein [Coleofasciculaceae cyanobacterium]
MDSRKATLRLKGVDFFEGGNFGTERYKAPNLAGADFKGVNFKGVVGLHKAKLQKANFENAILTGVALVGADLWKANLRGATLNRTDLRGGIFIDAELPSAVLNNSELLLAHFLRANLTEAHLVKAHAQNADFRKAKLVGADLTGTNLTKAKLAGADLTGANLVGANLAGADLTGTLLTKANLTGANLAGTELLGADFTGAQLKGTILDPEAPIPGLSLEQLAQAGFEITEDGAVLGYRTQEFGQDGQKFYMPGESYTAPWFSRDASSLFHPGLHFYPTEAQAREEAETRMTVRAFKNRALRVAAGLEEVPTLPQIREREIAQKDQLKPLAIRTQAPVMQVKVPLGKARQSNIMQVGEAFRAPAFEVVKKI